MQVVSSLLTNDWQVAVSSARLL